MKNVYIFPKQPNFFPYRLQGRMEQMRRFRRQHEQLRAVIMRVLGPNLQALSAASGVAGDGDRSEVSDLVKLTRFFKTKLRFQIMKSIFLFR
jgi:hypothetical protein